MQDISKFSKKKSHRLVSKEALLQTKLTLVLGMWVLQQKVQLQVNKLWVAVKLYTLGKQPRSLEAGTAHLFPLLRKF